MNNVLFGRNSIKCAHCGHNEFEVTVNYLVPRAVQLECKCGVITPIAFFDQFDSAYGVNGQRTRSMFDMCYYEDLNPTECRSAVIEDIRAYKENRLPFDD